MSPKEDTWQGCLQHLPHHHSGDASHWQQRRADIRRGRSSTTAASLRTSMLRPHPQISNMQATPEELRDLIAYILSLRGQ
jgi:hypothetical protein